MTSLELKLGPSMTENFKYTHHRGGVLPSACCPALRARPSSGCSRHGPAEALFLRSMRLIRRPVSGTKVKLMNGESGLLIPVYLNQRMVFDLVAMLQGGISTVTRVSELSQERTSTERDVGGAFGLTNAFASLLKIGLSATRRQASGGESGRTAEEERVHTPASLFFALRRLLSEKEFLHRDGTEAPRTGMFLEFSATLNRNPVIEVMDALHQMLSMAELFTEPEQPRASRHQKGPKPFPKKNPVNQIEQFREMLRTGETTDLTTGALQSGHRAVVTLETQYLNDPSMGDVVDGTFTVVGKVTRVLAAGEGSVSLIRKTALGRMPQALLDQLLEGLNELSSAQGFALPTIEWQIKAPVVQILPVAIYT